MFLKYCLSYRQSPYHQAALTPSSLPSISKHSPDPLLLTLYRSILYSAESIVQGRTALAQLMIPGDLKGKQCTCDADVTTWI